MKRFFAILMLCGLMTVSMGRPLLAGDIEDIIDYFIDGLGGLYERSWPGRVQVWIFRGDKIDRPPFAPEDLAWINAYSSDFLPKFFEDKKAAANVAASYSEDKDVFLIPASFYKRPRGVQETMLHHETQHMKDAEKLLDADYTMTFLKKGYLDPTTQGILQGIMEARAYGEEMVWVYNKMKYYEKAKLSGDYSGPAVKDIEELYEKYKEAYEYFISANKDSSKNYNRDFTKVFGDAINSGQSVEEARHLLEIAFLNSDTFRDHYLTEWVRDMSLITDNPTSISIHELLDALGDDDENGKWLTKEDIFAADKFWKNLCSYEKTKDSEPCKTAYMRYCKKWFEEKWGSCKRLKTVWNCDNNCAYKPLEKKFFTTNDDWDLWNDCCALDENREAYMKWE